MLAAIGGAVVAGVVAAAIALVGGGGPDSPATANGEPAASAGDRPDAAAKSKPEPKPLTRSQLIAKADAICAESQRRYLAIRDLESELYTADVPYAEALVRFARKRVRELRRLRPPPPLRDSYREYVEAQERVLATDEQVLLAARRGDVAGIEAARAERDSEDALREGLSRQIGFEVCSAGQG